MTSPLTILLPLKGRHLHTLRFLFHADRAKLPYHFLIADGEVHPVIARVLENPRDAFPNLDIEYIRYPDDATYSDFYRKMADVSARVRTPYVMPADNDDFLIQSGIEHSIRALDSNSEYATYRGGVGGFSLHSNSHAALENVTGRVRQAILPVMTTYHPVEYSSSSVAQRIRDGFRTCQTTYYGIFRSEQLATIFRDLAELDLTDLHLHEAYFGMRVLALGKARSGGEAIQYMRQGGTATQNAGRADWAAHLINSRLTSDLAAVLNRISEVVAKTEKCDSAVFVAELRLRFSEKFRALLEEYYGAPSPHPVVLRERLKSLVKRLLPRRTVEDIHYARSRRYVLNSLAAGGASSQSVAAFRAEWTEIENVVSGEEFPSFVRRHAPQLLDRNADGAIGLVA